MQRLVRPGQHCYSVLIRPALADIWWFHFVAIYSDINLLNVAYELHVLTSCLQLNFINIWPVMDKSFKF